MNAEQQLTGTPSIDRPWMKWYKDPSLPEIPFGKNCYDFFLEVTKDYKHPLLEYYGNKYTASDIKKEVEETITRLTAMGVKEGDTVSFVFLNVPEAIFFWFALCKMGATTNLIKFDESPERIKFMCELTETQYLFVSDVPFILQNVVGAMDLGLSKTINKVITVPITASMSKAAVFKMFMGNFKSIVGQSGNSVKLPLQFLKYNNWKKVYKGTDFRTISDGGQNVSVIMYTGGTTGGAKGVETTNDSIIASACSFMNSEMEFYAPKTSMSILPPAVSYYFNATYNLMCCGVSVNLICKFSVEEYPSLIKEHRPNVFMAGPILFKSIRESGIDDLSFATDPISGGDKLHEEEEIAYHEFSRSKNCDTWIKQGYGLTESMAGVIYSIKPALTKGSIGIPLKYAEIGVFDYMSYDEFDPEKLKEKTYGEIGELCISGPTVMKGYIKNPDETKKMLRIHKDGKVWLHTDDLCYMDEEGRIYHCGRAKRMLTRSGGKVWLGTIEDTVKSHPLINNCCCVKYDDPEEREVPVAHIVLESNNYSEDIISELDALIKSKCPETYVPKYYVIRKDIPITEVNKKVDFKSLENENIFDKSKYSIKDRAITLKE